MSTAISIRDVAHHARVSISTVSNVLNHPELVAEKTRARVHEAITALGFVRNDPARQLRAGRSRQIAIVVLDVTNPFFTDVIRGAEDAAENRGVTVVVCNSSADVDRERRHLDLLEEQRIRGVLITPVDDTPASRLEKLIERGTPVVLVDRGSGWPNRCSVAVDDVYGGRLAGDHLLAQGHRKIAFAGGPMSVRQVAERRSGFVASAAGTAEVVTISTPTLSVAAGRAAAGQIAGLDPHERPTAVFCGNDMLALGVLQELTHRGLHVPHDFAIVGYDDIEFAAAAAVPLSSVRQPRVQLGRTATELLLDETGANGKHEHRHVLFQPELVVRASSDFLRRPRKAR